MDLVKKVEESFLTLESGKIYQSIIGDAEKVLIEKALERTHGNQILAARILGLNRNTLRTKIKKLNVNPGQFKRKALSAN